MYKKINLKTLAIVLGSVIALIVFIQLFRSRKGERTIPKSIINSDTAAITSIIINSYQDKEPLSLIRNGNLWTVEKAGKKFNADLEKINELLTIITNIKPERVAGIDKNVWKQFEVTDSAAIKVTLKKGSKKTETILIGKFSYQQPSGNDYMSMYNRQGKMSTYVRKIGDTKTYAVNGFLRMSFQTEMTAYRNKTVIRSAKSLWNKLSFIYPGDSSFTLQKSGNKWLLNNIPADSALTEGFLSSIENIQNYSIEENAIISQTPSHKLKIEGTNLSVPIEITAFPADSINGTFITSSMNKEGVFSGNKSALFSRVFVGKNRFMQQSQ